MRRINFLIIIALIYSCGSAEKSGETTAQNVLEDVLTLELSFGAENLPDVYLLAKPRHLAVNDAGDIYILDEWKIKTYDSMGQPMKIFGGYGQGPGEFSKIAQNIEFTHEGLFWVREGQYLNIFSQEHDLIEKRLLYSDATLQSICNDFGVYIDQRSWIIPLNEHELIVLTSTVSMSTYQISEKGAFNYLFYVNSDKIKVLAKYKEISTVITLKGGGGSFTHLGNEIGKLIVALLPDNKIVYVNTAIDVEIKGEVSVLTLHIVDLENFEEREIFYQYTPEKIPLTEIEKYETRGRSHDQKIVKLLKDRMYLPPLYRLTTDGKYIILCNLLRNETGEITEEEICTFIDSENGDVLQTAIFPYLWGKYKNGYYYNLRTSAEEFPVLEKYRVDPAVYEK
ncbi:hypothetical protein ACFL6L_03935 [candidate division KSB1 bacterium]